MISKLRVKFIIISMASMLAVLLLIIAGINTLNYISAVSDADQTLSYLAANSGEFPMYGIQGKPGGDQKPPREDGLRPDGSSPAQNGKNRRDDRFAEFEEGLSPETPFELRYFSVLFDESGTAVTVNTSRISAVDDTSAAEYARSVLAGKRDRGFIDNYRFLRSDTGDGVIVVFLDCRRSLDSSGSFLTASLIISACGLLAVFLLIYLFSGWVFRPVAESYEKQKRFITDAGHEIKTPLAIISADADVLEMDLGEGNEWLGDIKKQVGELTGLTNDLVYLSKMEESGAQLNSRELCISDIAEDVISSFRLAAASRGKTFESDISPALTLSGDEKALRRLISILLDNALKYSPDDGEIKVRLEKQNRSVLLTVYNTSSDEIERGSLDRLFDRFYRSDPSRNSQTGGHGIGLSVAKAIALAHHGRISAASGDGHSLTVSALLNNI